MFLKMKRTQKTAFGNLRAGVAYRFDKATPGHSACVKNLLAREMAEEVSQGDLDEAKTKAETLVDAQALVRTKAEASAAKTKPTKHAVTANDPANVSLTKNTGAA